MAVDWLKIRSDYINGGGSYRALAEKYGVSVTSICAKAKKEGWQTARRTQLNKTCTKVEQKTAEKISDAESEAAAIKARMRLVFFQEIERRTKTDEVDGMEFRRLVQSYKDLCELSEDGRPADERREDPLSESLRELAKELEHDGQ